MTIYAVYKRNSGNQPDTMLSYSTNRDAAEQLIPPNTKDLYIQELPKLEISKPTYSSGLWTRDDATKWNEENQYLKKSVVTKPMTHRTNFPTELPAPVTNYIKSYSNNTIKQGLAEVSLFNCEENLQETRVNLKYIKHETASSLQISNEEITREPVKAPVLNKPEIKRKVYHYDTSKPKQPNKPSYTAPIKKYEIHEVNGTNVFRWSFRYCYPDMKPNITYSYEANIGESNTVKFLPGDYVKDRDFALVVYAKTKDKATALVKAELKRLIDSGVIRK